MSSLAGFWQCCDILLQAALVIGAAKEADQLAVTEHCREEALHSSAEQLQDLETALTQATAANLDLAQHQRQDKPESSAST